MADHKPPEQPHDSHQEYESDRRGEHKYPESDREQTDRPSQRERDELKKRMERGRSGAPISSRTRSTSVAEVNGFWRKARAESTSPSSSRSPVYPDMNRIGVPADMLRTCCAS